MSQKVERYRKAAWDLLESIPEVSIHHSRVLCHYSKNGKTYFDFSCALVMYGHNHYPTVAVDKITSKAEIVDDDDNDITECTCNRYHQEFLEFFDEILD